MTLKDDNQNPNTTKNAFGPFLPKSKVSLGEKKIPHKCPNPLCMGLMNVKEFFLPILFF